ncbi:MAG: diguanylate cyclase [Nitrospirae bacterium]|nr:MAG: diguanylate cyclase [Nitrospirota bacterium]
MEVLIADDDPISLHALKSKLLKWQYKVVSCRDGLEAARLLQSDKPPRLAILDWMMPGLDGPEICRQVRAHRGLPYIYILLLTSRSEKTDLVAGLEAGADDYLTKPVHVDELDVRLRAGCRIITLQEELLATQEALRIQATHDPLTGVLNRAAILEHLERELARAQREGSQLSVILVDLDNFKYVNDSHGHLVGDAVLVEACRRIRSCIRPYDLLGRYGGEEFLIVLPGSDSAAALSQANRIREAIGTHVYRIADQELPVTCSQGVTTWTGTSQGDLESLLKTADGGMYLAKYSGRNRVEYIELDQKPILPHASLN